MIDAGHLMWEFGQQLPPDFPLPHTFELEFGKLGSQLRNGREDGRLNRTWDVGPRRGGIGIGDSQRRVVGCAWCPTSHMIYVLCHAFRRSMHYVLYMCTTLGLVFSPAASRPDEGGFFSFLFRWNKGGNIPKKCNRVLRDNFTLRRVCFG